MLLWRGIARFVARHPRYALLIGPVSISNDYAPPSRRLMVDFLSHHRQASELARHVRPRRPFRTQAILLPADTLACPPRDIDDVSRAVAQIERDAKGVPILLKQYLKLGGKLLGFNADPLFGNAVDGLIRVDLRTTERRVLVHYMGETGAESFLRWHGVGSCALARAS
jgi:putative hemolysin